jgi:hypothetical protein
MHELGGMLQQERTACVMCTVDAAKQSKVLLTVLFEKKVNICIAKHIPHQITVSTDILMDGN